MSTDTRSWAELAAAIQGFHENGAAAVKAAQEAGLDIETFSGAVFNGPPLATGPYPVLYFGPWHQGGPYYTAQPNGCGRFAPVERGGAPIEGSLWRQV